MKRNLLLLIVLCCTMTMMAQNGKISYQAVVRDSENHLVYDTPLQVTVSLANSETGTAVYSEQHAVTSNANGLISLLIGDGQNKQGHWEDVQWNTAWVTATIRKASDQTFLAEHHLPLSAVPYALYADFADSVNLAVLQDYLDEHHYVTEDELPAVQANADWTETNPDTASYIKNKPDLNDYEKKSELCGDVKECIKDTLKYYTTSDQIDTLLGAYYDTTHTKSVISDTATALRAMMGDAAYNSKITLKKNNVELDSFRLNQQTDKAINIPVPTTVAELSDAGNYVTKTKLNDTLGAYYDTANVKQMLKPYLKANELCDSIVKCEVVKNMRDSLGNAFDTLKYYTTSNEIDTLLGAYFDSTKVKSVISDTADAIRAAIPASQVNADWNATGGPAEILNKPDLSVYATTNALKDSLSRYVGKDKLNDTLDSYYTKNNIDSKLNDYEKKSELCGDVKDCIKDTLGKYTTSNQIDTLLRAYYDTTHTKSVISDTATALRAMMGDAAYNAKITLKKNNVELDSFRLNQQTDKAINIPVPTTVAELSDAGNYVTKTKLNDTLGAYYDTANVKQMLKPYLKANELCDSIVKCGVIKDMRDSIRDNAAAIQTNATNIGFNKQAIIDSSAHIRNEIKYGQITIALNRGSETGVTNPTFGVNQADTQIVTINIPEATTVNNGQLTLVAAGDTTRFTANQATNDTMRLNKFATKDTLKNFVNKLDIRDSVNVVMLDSLEAANSAINKAIDTIARNNIHDTAMAIRLHIRDSVNVVMLDSLEAANSAINKAIDTIARNNIHDTAMAIRLHIRDSVNVVMLDSLEAANSAINKAIDTIARNNIHDTAMAIRLHIRDSVNVVMLDSLEAANSAINKAIDTIARNNIHDTAMAIRLHIRDSVNVVMLDSLEAANSAINKAIDTIARNNIHDTAMAIRLHIRDSVNVVMLDSLEAANSAINKAIDTIARNNIHDTAMAIRLHIRDSVNVVMLDSLEAANSAINKAIDTIARNNIHDTAMAIRLHIRDSVNVVMLDSLEAANSAINKAIDTIARNNIHDTAMAIRLHIRDSVNVVMLDSLEAANSAINKAIDTIARNNIHDTAMAIRLHIRDSVNVVMLDSLEAANSAINKAIDTIARNNIHDTAMAIRLHIRDSVNVVMLDSLEAANSAINKAIDTIARHNIHDTAMAIRNSIKDGILTVKVTDGTTTTFSANTSENPTVTLAKVAETGDFNDLSNKPAPVNDNAVVIQLNGSSAGSFTLNQSTDETIDLRHIAITNTDNTFTGKNDFTAGTTQVASAGVDLKTATYDPTTCSNTNAVNVCDLLAVFDSLKRQIQSLENELAAMKSAMNSTNPVLILEDKTTNSITVSASASISAFKIEKYKYCCTDCGTGGTPICSPIVFTDNYTFDNLEPYTSYHFTVETYTSFDTVESSSVAYKTSTLAPTAQLNLSSMPTGVNVTLDDIDLKGVSEGTIKISYKLSTDAVYPEPSLYHITSEQSLFSNDIFNLAANAQYDVKAEISNGDETTMLTGTINSGNLPTLNVAKIFPIITGNNTRIPRCKPNENQTLYENYVLFKAGLSDNNYNDYYYQWSITNDNNVNNSTEEVMEMNGDSCLIYFRLQQNHTNAHAYTVTCKVTHKRNANITQTGSVTFQFRSTDNCTTTFPSISTNEVGYTVTVTGSNFTKISWQDDALLESASNGATHTYKDISGLQTIAAYSSNGCKKSEDVNIAALLNISTSPSDNISVCQGDQKTITYTAEPATGEGAVSDYNYVWSVTGGLEHTDNGNTCVVTYSATNTSYTVSCTATHKTTTGKTISNNKKTTVTKLTTLPSYTICVEGLSVTLKNANHVSSVDWGGEGTGSSTYHKYNAANTYTITATADNGCTASETVTVSADASLTPCTGVIHQSDKYNQSGYEQGTTNAITHVRDNDGNVYPVVQIGSQCWMAENMRCTHSPSTGTLIVKTETGNNVTYNKFIKVAHWWNNDEASNQKYGLLYNWCAAVDTFYKAGGYGETSTSGGTPSGDWMPTLNEDRQGICPKGWHIPTDSEWGTMLSQVGDKPAGKLSSGCDWYGSSTDKNNRPNSYNDPNRSISGFGAKPAGFFDDNTMDVSGNSSPLTRYAYFWSASPYSPESGSQIAIIRYLAYNAAQVTRDDDNGDIRNGYSVRCLRNVETLALDVTGDNNISTCTGDPASSSYSATVTFGGDIDNDFTYSWSVSGGATVSSAAGNSCTISYPTVGAYTVTCTATKGTESIEKEISVNFSMGSLPSFTTYEDNLTVTVYSQTNVSSFNWGGTVTSSTSSSCIYASNGIYTITATSGDGCMTQKTVAVGTATLHPCTVSEPHSNYTGGGFNGANDGRETVVEGKITSVTDYDGNEYPVTQIGSQCWLAENMRCEHSPSHDDGVSILNPDNKSGSNASGRKGSQVAQWYNNNSANASKSYGLLYNWCAAVDTFNAVAGATIHTDAGPWWGCNFVGNRRGICPKGWHVPTVEEWNQMESYVNGSTVDHSTTNYVGTLAGELSKGGNWSGTSSLDYPNRPNTYADENRNSSGFGAVPAGYTQYSSGYVFAGAGTSACFWTATKYPTDNTYRYVRKLQNDKEGVKNSYDQQTNQYSVRCVRD